MNQVHGPQTRSSNLTIQGAPEATYCHGGEQSQGPTKGVYRFFVNEASIGNPSNATGRFPLVLDIFVKGDTNHPEKEGKRLEKYRQWLPMTSDDKEKKATMKGMLNRQVFVPFGLDFPKDEKVGSLDTRIFAGKTGYALVGDVKQQDGTFKNGIVAMAATEDKLPKPRLSTEEPGTEAKPNGKRRRG